MNNIKAHVGYETQKEVSIEFNNEKLEGIALIKDVLHNEAHITIRELDHTDPNPK